MLAVFAENSGLSISLVSLCAAVSEARCGSSLSVIIFEASFRQCSMANMLAECRQNIFPQTFVWQSQNSLGTQL